MTPQDAIDTLTARVAALEEKLAEVTDELRSARRGSMREDHRCPACGGGELFHITRATQTTDMQVLPIGLVHDFTWRGMKVYGPLEYYVCRTCRLVEGHAIDLVGVEANESDVLILSAPPPTEPPPSGPYR